MLAVLLSISASRLPRRLAAATDKTMQRMAGHAEGAAAFAQDKPADPLGATSYKSQCAVCHGVDRKGVAPVFPSLIDVQTHYTDAQITDIIHNGKGRMPAQPAIDPATVIAIIAYLKVGDVEPPAKPAAIQAGNRNEVAGAKVYDKNCAICHGEDLLGAPSNYPGLVGVRTRLSDQQILTNVHQGKGRMPSFQKLSAADTDSLLRFLGDRNASTTKQP